MASVSNGILTLDPGEGSVSNGVLMLAAGMGGVSDGVLTIVSLPAAPQNLRLQSAVRTGAFPLYVFAWDAVAFPADVPPNMRGYELQWYETRNLGAITAAERLALSRAELHITASLSVGGVPDVSIPSPVKVIFRIRSAQTREGRAQRSVWTSPVQTTVT